MQGEEKVKDHGIVPRSASMIFEEIKVRKENLRILDSVIQMSCFELHKETVRDLLNSNNHQE
jgi:hypothetical protein